MAFEDLTDDQVKLVCTLVEAVNTGKYQKEFYYGTLFARSLVGWTGGMQNILIRDASESDIRIAREEGYLHIKQEKNRIVWVALLKKAFDAYIALHQSEVVLNGTESNE